MTKDQLIEKIAAKCACSKKSVTEFLAAFEDIISQALSRGEEVRLTGFGNFIVAKRGSRAGVNPRTGEKIKIPAMKVPKFRPGSVLKQAVR